jgi:tRNA(fMet)-specific endonuclease VapC
MKDSVDADFLCVGGNLKTVQVITDNIGFTSAITVAELSVGAHLSKRKDALDKTLELISLVEVIDINKDVAIEGGKIYSGLVKKGETIELNDCLISATSISQGVNQIVTRNVNHFERINEIKVFTPEDLGY